MEISEYYLSLGNYLHRRSHKRRAAGVVARGPVSYLLIVLFLCLVAFVSISVSRFISATMFSTLSEADILDSTTRSTSDIAIRKGDTLNKILAREGVTREEIKDIVAALNAASITLNLKAGKSLTFTYETVISENDSEDLTSETSTLSQISFVLGSDRRIEITKENDRWYAEDITVPLKKIVSMSSAEIKGSFMHTAKSLGISTNNILELIQAYSYNVDFERQIKAGDKLTFISEKFYTEDGKLSHHGKVIYASMNLAGKELKIYRYSPDNSGKFEYFSEDGRSVKRSLLRTPVNVARVSSKFGTRKHPVHGYSAMHKGVDFSAPIGTPIYAAGSGVITEIGWRSGYGRFIQVKHSQNLSTAYAHASSFAKDLKVGSKVSQGQVIAYVGMTGRTTGPHVHFEVKVNGRQVDPMSIKTTPGMELKGKALMAFKQFKAQVHNIKDDLVVAKVS